MRFEEIKDQQNKSKLERELIMPQYGEFIQRNVQETTKKTPPAPMKDPFAMIWFP